MNNQVVLNPRIIEQYGQPGPRYPSYPTADRFHEGFDANDFRWFARRSNEDFIPRPLSLYVHLPFCQSSCYFCACHRKITRHPRQGAAYLACLDREIAMQATLFDPDREVRQLHFGGGTPTYFTDEQLEGTLAVIERDFSIRRGPEREYSIEVDPRTVDAGRVLRLAEMGFNRLCLGIQDCDPRVQLAVNRVQDPDQALSLISAARDAGFHSVVVDLIYGLPLQTEDSFAATVDRVLEFRPNRVSVFGYAHLPDRFRAQRLIRTSELPDPALRWRLLQVAIERLTDAGYEFRGRENFALPGDDRCRARREGSQQRDFQGDSPFSDCDLVGLGASAISRLHGCFSQNASQVRTWEAAIETGRLPVSRGIALRREDLIRARVIGSIMGLGKLAFAPIETEFDLDFTDFFAPEFEALLRLEAEGLLQLTEEGLEATPAGRLLAGCIAMVFDEYLQVDHRAFLASVV